MYQNKCELVVQVARSFTHLVPVPLAVCTALPLTNTWGLMGVPYEKLTKRVIPV